MSKLESRCDGNCIWYLYFLRLLLHGRFDLLLCSNQIWFGNFSAVPLLLHLLKLLVRVCPLISYIRQSCELRLVTSLETWFTAYKWHEYKTSQHFVLKERPANKTVQSFEVFFNSLLWDFCTWALLSFSIRSFFSRWGRTCERKHISRCNIFSTLVFTFQESSGKCVEFLSTKKFGGYSTKESATRTANFYCGFTYERDKYNCSMLVASIHGFGHSLQRAGVWGRLAFDLCFHCRKAYAIHMVSRTAADTLKDPTGAFKSSQKLGLSRTYTNLP